MKRTLTMLVCAIAMTGAVTAATPPDAINYQGVLRDSAGDPLDGAFDITFRLFSADVGGDEILVDEHLAAGTGAVTVSDGMFSAGIGSGAVADGSGPGVYTALAAAFRDYGNVHLEVSVGAETLTPRVPVSSAGYALNAAQLDGRDPGAFLDTSVASQTKTGSLTVGSLIVSGTNVNMSSGGYMYGNASTLQLHAGTDDGDSLWFYSGNDYYDGGLFIYGDARTEFVSGNGQFEYRNGDLNQQTAVLDPVGNLQIDGDLTVSGGQVRTASTSDYSKLCVYSSDTYCIGMASAQTYGDLNDWAMTFTMNNDFDRGFLWRDDADTAGDGAMSLTTNGNLTVKAAVKAPILYDTNNTSFYVNPAGTSNMSVVRMNAGYTYLNFDGPDTTQSIYFYDNGSFSDEHIRWDDSLDAFRISDDLYISDATYGVQAYGSSAGGYFLDSTGSGYALVGDGDQGGNFLGNLRGVRGYDLDNATYAYLASGTSSTVGNGTKNFIQNHPYRPGEVIVYAAPEGNEAATYTRGSTRLRNGEVRIALDETFGWVTNPDIGLTANLTARSPNADLYVAELTTSALVVRSNRGSDDEAVFDYMVRGLRIGFEEVSVVQEKGADEARIPSMDIHRERQRLHPEWTKHVPLQRFKAMRTAMDKEALPDMTATAALRAAIGEYDPAIHGNGDPTTPSREDPDPIVVPAAEASGGEAGDTATGEVAAPAYVAVGVPQGPSAPEPGTDAAAGTAADEDPDTAHELTPAYPALPVAVAVETGDLLTIDEAGNLTIALTEADPRVVGVVAGEMDDDRALAPVAAFGIVSLKVDADLGAIRVGDLLVSSPTPGHAMRAYAEIPGTVIAKAIDSLDAGTGVIRVVVMLR